MQIAFNALKTLSLRTTPVLNSWFHGDEAPPTSSDRVEASTVQPVPVQPTGLQIRNSLRALTDTVSTIPAMPRFVSEMPPSMAPSAAPSAGTPYQILSDTLDATSVSSKWLDGAGLLSQFQARECFVDMSMTSEGGASAVLRSPGGYRRTILCRADGSISQRIIGPTGAEIVRFNTNGEAIKPREVKRDMDDLHN